MQIFIEGSKTIKEFALAHLITNNPWVDPAELRDILNKACTRDGEEQRDMLLADAVEIIID